jgi:hypothetical protein
MKWLSAVDACPQGPARWKLTDSIKEWGRLEKLDDALLTTTVDRQLLLDQWAILNVVSVLMPKTFIPHEDVEVVIPETRATVYWNFPPLQAVIEAIVATKTSWTQMVR